MPVIDSGDGRMEMDTDKTGQVGASLIGVADTMEQKWNSNLLPRLIDGETGIGADEEELIASYVPAADALKRGMVDIPGLYRSFGESVNAGVEDYLVEGGFKIRSAD
jgi:hypothetical protein